METHKGAPQTRSVHTTRTCQNWRKMRLATCVVKCSHMTQGVISSLYQRIAHVMQLMHSQHNPELKFSGLQQILILHSMGEFLAVTFAVHLNLQSKNWKTQKKTGQTLILNNENTQFEF